MPCKSYKVDRCGSAGMQQPENNVYRSHKTLAKRSKDSVGFVALNGPVEEYVYQVPREKDDVVARVSVNIQ